MISDFNFCKDDLLSLISRVDELEMRILRLEKCLNSSESCNTNKNDTIEDEGKKLQKV